MIDRNHPSLLQAAEDFRALRCNGLNKFRKYGVKAGIDKFIQTIKEHFPHAAEVSAEMLQLHEDLMSTGVAKTSARNSIREFKRFAQWLQDGRGIIKDFRYAPPLEQKLKSAMAGTIQQFIKRKQDAGTYSSRTPEALIHFDAMLSAEFPNAVIITKEIVQRWIEILSSKQISNNTFNHNIAPIRQLSLFIQSYIDPSSAVIPNNIGTKYEFYIGHMITQDELQAFFHKADALEFNAKTSFRHLTAPTAFRLMYSSGVRGSEIRLLTRDDINLKNGKIKIRESKAHAMRIIIVHPDMLEVLQRYDAEIDKQLPQRKWFFISHKDGRQMSHHLLGQWFRFIWDQMAEELELPASKPQANARDLRHLYALSIIREWHRKGLSLKAMEPYLACYMGHASFEMTSYYIHLESSFLPDFQAISQRSIAGLFDDAEDLDNDEEVPYDA